MTQFSMLSSSVISSSAKNIVDKFIGMNEDCADCMPNERLMSSLYSLMPNTDSKVIDILKDRYIISLSEYLTNTEIECLIEEYPAVVKYCYDYVDSYGISSFLPQSIIDLCMTLAEPRPGASVYIPYSGNGEFAFHLADYVIDGFEKDPDLWALSQVLYHSRFGKIANIRLGDYQIEENKKYDYIFSFPPMYTKNIDVKEVAEILYNLIVKHLNNKYGEIYCILPMNFCDDSEWSDIRKIVRSYNNMIDTLVISLPQTNGVNLCLFKIRYGAILGEVTLVDATDEIFYKQGYNIRKVYNINIPILIDNLKFGDQKYKWRGSSKSLIGNQNLRPSDYLYSSIALSNVAKSVKIIDLQLPQVNSKANAQIEKKLQNFYPVVSIKDLSSDYLNCNIDRNELTVSKKRYYRVLNCNCILIGYVGGKFKVGRLQGVNPSSPVWLAKDIMAVTIDSEIDITEEYFLRSVMSKEVEYQASELPSVKVFGRFSLIDFNFIKIEVPTLIKYQEAICKTDVKASISNAERKIKESNADRIKEMHMIKHAMGQTLLTLNSWWKVFLDVRKENNGIISDNATTGKIRKIPVTSIYDSIQNSIFQLQQQIDRFDRGNGLPVTTFALTEYIEDYIRCKQSPIFEFIFENSLHRTAQKAFEESEDMDLNAGYVNFAKDALGIIFDNIISNACSHGFVGRDNNIVKIELHADGDRFVITISNNGLPMHPQMKPEEVFIYGRSSKMGNDSNNGEHHFGIGGYEINKLMQQFGGDAEFISQPEAKFPITYKLSFFYTNFQNVKL